MELVFFQSNHEGELVDMLHKHIDSAAGALLNPAGLTQFGVSLHDAIKTMPYPGDRGAHLQLATRARNGATTRSSRRR